MRTGVMCPQDILPDRDTEVGVKESFKKQIGEV